MNLISKLLVITLVTLLGSSFSNAQAVKNVWEGAYTEAQAENGEMLYQEHCSACHGSQMQGIEEAPTLKQGAFIYNWDDLGVDILFQRIRETMPLDDPRGVSRTIKADILAYLMSENNFPAGTVKLPYQNSRLKRIKWNAQKPTDD
ncbi:MAG: c-type cytochrome [Kordiimonadaceae bacterium]|jgi:S-disulfanyl-L-cysteine oxidoreductase SoxD|nr:c-type cytochrome [Kordiimonadaceae bacterium]MDG1004193.1 cytochrome c [Emcibacteraceae bacterium]